MKKQKIISLILAAALLFTSADMTIAARAQENTAAVVLNEAEPTGTPEEMKEEEPALEPTEEPEAIPTATPTAVPEEGQEEATQEPSASPEMTPEPEKQKRLQQHRGRKWGQQKIHCVHLQHPLGRPHLQAHHQAYCPLLRLQQRLQ